MRTVTVGRCRFAVADDKQGFWDRVEAGTWEPETLHALAALVGPGTTLLDIGAWIGPITLTAAALGATVLALEPDPRAHEMLAGNLAANPDLQPRIRPLARALSPGPGPVRLGSPRKPGDSMASVLLADRAASSWTAEALTPADLAAELPPGPLVLKLDVEGAEYALLPAMRPLLDRAGAALIAFHPRILQRIGHGPDVVARLTREALAPLADFAVTVLEIPATDTLEQSNATVLFRRERAP